MKMKRQQFIVCFLFVIATSTNGQNVECNTNATHFDVLPGFGWDNLRNVEASRVVTFNYSECQLTADGKYLLPHGVSILPLKQSKLDQYSELFETFTDYTSVTAETINKDPGFRIQGSKISGRFSDNFLKSKQLQVEEKSKVTRAQLKFVKYKVKLQPDTQLSNAFKITILNIARHVLFDRHQMARYESEMLVRDFGTHVITSVDTGAAIVQEDHMKGNSDNFTRENVVLGASMSLQEATGIGLNYDTNSSSMKAILEEYKSNRLQSYVKTYGGPPFMSSDWSRSWTSNLDNNLVAMDRTGEPIYNFINLKTVPTVPVSILYDVTTYIKNAVRDYYAYNTFPGCADVNSMRFNSLVNVDDGSCTVDMNNDNAFGGLFQTCSVKSNEAGDVCSHLSQSNLQTKSHSCPPNFDRNEIYTWHFEKTSSKRVCKKCYGFFNCCDDEPVKSSAELKSYICTNKKSTLGTFEFGGFYSSISDNPLTKGQSCPENFEPRKIGDDISMCVTNTPNAKTNVTFGGLYSCDHGNPLAGSSATSRSCPKGFSTLLAGVINDCPIYYCVFLSDFPSNIPQMIKRPPFTARLKMHPGKSGEQVVYDPETQQWLSELESRELKEKEAAIVLTSGEAAVIAIFVTVAFILLLALAFYCYRKRKNQYPMGRSNNSNSTTRNSTSRQDDAV